MSLYELEERLYLYLYHGAAGNIFMASKSFMPKVTQPRYVFQFCHKSLVDFQIVTKPTFIFSINFYILNNYVIQAESRLLSFMLIKSIHKFSTKKIETILGTRMHLIVNCCRCRKQSSFSINSNKVKRGVQGIELIKY